MKRILFVDDDSSILSALRRTLRKHHEIWDMVFVESPDAALAEMGSQPFDVIVSDMRMPRMDGAKLLAAVQQLHPRTVRIVLSGYANLEATMRSVSVSHQYLTKPCEADTLREVVERACDLEELLDDPRLRDTLGDVSSLPVLPKTYRALTAALADPEVDLDRVGAIVESDQAIALKILQLVNSSFFGLRAEVSSVRQATSILGVDTIRDLVLSFEVVRQFDEANRVPGFDMEREQAHSLLAARIARRLLPDKKAAEKAFLAAMVHDVGKLVLATHLPDLFARCLAGRARSEEPGHRVETELLGVSHAEIGAYLLQLWGMPYPVVEAVAHHHDPARVQDQASFGILGAVHVADSLAHEVVGEAAQSREGVNEGYLEQLRVAEHLPEWRELAAAEAAVEDEAA